MDIVNVAPPRGERGLKLVFCRNCKTELAVAPPRGERGLKLPELSRANTICSRSPSRGAWIETMPISKPKHGNRVAPPRGERGLKHSNRNIW